MSTARPRLPDKRQALYDLLLDDIRSGRQPADSRLPSEWELVAQYGVSRTTVRSALAQLERHGLVRRRKGRGTWVHPEATGRLAATQPVGRRITLVLSAGRMNNPIFSGILTVFHATLPAHCHVSVHHHHALKPALYTDAEVVVIDGEFDPADVAAVRERVPHVVVLNRLHPGLPSCCTDNLHGGMLMAEHAIARGHRRIGVLHFGDDHAGGRSVEEFTLRLQGIRAACRKAGIVPIEVALELRRMYDFGPAAAVDRLLAIADDLTVILAVADQLALDALERLVERGIAVPHRIGIIGFDGLDTCRFSSPALTTVRQPVEELGRLLANGVLALLDGRPSGLGPPLRPHLVARDTCPEVAR